MVARDRATPAKRVTKAPTKTAGKTRTTKKATGRPTLLTAAVEHSILTDVEGGAYPSQAAMAAGILPGTYAEWIRRGEGRDDRPAEEPYATFAVKVSCARAKARVRKERELYEQDPWRWLNHGPGRLAADAGGEERWTNRTELTGPGGAPLGPTVVTIRYESDWDTDDDA